MRHPHQKERFTDEAVYESVKGAYVIDPKVMKAAKERLIVMHPLPRVGGISPEFDDDPRAAYSARWSMGYTLEWHCLPWF